MPSPIAHSLAGLALGRIVAPDDLRRSPGWLALAVFTANAPDLDFAAGLVIGQVNAFHGGPTHSIGAALCYAALGTGVARMLGRRGARWFVALALIYASHFALDMCAGFPERPTALAVLWPFHDARLSLPWQPLLGIVHGRKGASFDTFLGELAHPSNLRAMGTELAIFGLLALGAVRATASRPAATPTPAAATAGGDPSAGP